MIQSTIVLLALMSGGVAPTDSALFGVALAGIPLLDDPANPMPPPGPYGCSTPGVIPDAACVAAAKQDVKDAVCDRYADYLLEIQGLDNELLGLLEECDDFYADCLANNPGPAKKSRCRWIWADCTMSAEHYHEISLEESEWNYTHDLGGIVAGFWEDIENCCPQPN